MLTLLIYKKRIIMKKILYRQCIILWIFSEKKKNALIEKRRYNKTLNVILMINKT